MKRACQIWPTGVVVVSGEDSQWQTHLSLLRRLRELPTDQAAWTAFVKCYEPLLRLWCREHGLQEADAQDVVQNILLKLATHMQSFVYDPALRFRGWLRVVTRNAFVDFLKGQRHAIAGSGDSRIFELLGRAEAPSDLAGRLESYFDHELLAQAEIRVRQRIADHTWEAYRLTAVEGKSGAEAAHLLGMKPSTVFKAKSKVLKMLREEIDRLERESDSCLSVQPPLS
jgi:RNA polymerase sigma factor (sigma-70 family)